MKSIIFTVCCWAIALWTALCIASGFWYLSEIAALQADWAAAVGLPGGVGIAALWIAIQILSWGAVVTPLALIAILARPAWPIEKAATSDDYMALPEIERREPISPA